MRGSTLHYDKVQGSTAVRNSVLLHRSIRYLGNDVSSFLMKRYPVGERNKKSLTTNKCGIKYAQYGLTFYNMQY